MAAASAIAGHFAALHCYACGGASAPCLGPAQEASPRASQPPRRRGGAADARPCSPRCPRRRRLAALHPRECLRCCGGSPTGPARVTRAELRRDVSAPQAPALIGPLGRCRGSCFAPRSRRKLAIAGCAGLAETDSARRVIASPPGGQIRSASGGKVMLSGPACESSEISRMGRQRSIARARRWVRSWRPQDHALGFH